jgi:hypothetical protein
MRKGDYAADVMRITPEGGRGRHAVTAPNSVATWAKAMVGVSGWVCGWVSVAVIGFVVVRGFGKGCRHVPAPDDESSDRGEHQGEPPSPGGAECARVARSDSSARTRRASSRRTLRGSGGPPAASISRTTSSSWRAPAPGVLAMVLVTPGYVSVTAGLTESCDFVVAGSSPGTNCDGGGRPGGPAHRCSGPTCPGCVPSTRPPSHTAHRP